MAMPRLWNKCSSTTLLCTLHLQHDAHWHLAACCTKLTTRRRPCMPFSLPTRSSTTCLRVSGHLTVNVCHQRYNKLYSCCNIAIINTAGKPCGYVLDRTVWLNVRPLAALRNSLRQQGQSGPLPANFTCKMKPRSLVSCTILAVP